MPIFVATMVGAAVLLWAERDRIAGSLLALRTDQSFAVVLVGDSRGTVFNSLALGAPRLADGRRLLVVQWWATLLFALPLYTTRQASQRFVEMRDMFTQTIGALGRGGRQARSVHGAA